MQKKSRFNLTKKISDIGNIELFFIIRFIFACACFSSVASLPLSTFIGSNSPSVPLIDFIIFKSSFAIYLGLILFFTSIFFFSIGYMVRYSGILAGISHFFFLITFPAGVLSFSHLLPLGCLAFAVSDLQKVSKSERSFPLVLLVSSVYLTASLQKLFHFELMRVGLPAGLAQLGRDWFLVFCPAAQCGLTGLMTYFVVPVEFLLAALFLMPKTRLYGYIFAVLFHTVLGTVASIRAVGFYMLLLECSIAVSATDLTLNKILDRKRMKPFLFFSVALVILHFSLYFLDSFKPLDDLILTTLLYSPLFFISIFCFLNIQPGRLIFSGANFGFIALLILFAFTPVLDSYHKFHQWGWSMFSGARNKNKVYSIKLRMAENIELLNYFPLIFLKKESSNVVVLSSTSKDLLTRYAEVVQKNHPKTQIESEGVEDRITSARLNYPFNRLPKNK